MKDIFGTVCDGNGRAIVGPRYESNPSQPKHVPEMTRDEEDELFDATLEREDVSEMVWEAIIDELNKEQAKEIVNVLFRQCGNSGDFTECGRLLHRFCWKRVQKIVEGEEHNTDMGED